MRHSPSLAWLVIAVLLAACGERPAADPQAADPVATTPTEAGVASVAILDPFQGKWTVDADKTLALWKAGGMSQAQVDQQGAVMKQIGMPLHPDMHIQGNVALLPGAGMLQGVEGEYLLFALHPHGPWVCGKAWHHEDRHDPGDEPLSRPNDTARASKPHRTYAYFKGVTSTFC